MCVSLCPVSEPCTDVQEGEGAEAAAGEGQMEMMPSHGGSTNAVHPYLSAMINYAQPIKFSSFEAAQRKQFPTIKAQKIRHAPPLTTQSSSSERCSSRCFLRPWNPHIQRRKYIGSDSSSLEFRRCVVNRLDPGEEIGDRLDIRNPFPGTFWMRSAAIINASEMRVAGWG